MPGTSVACSQPAQTLDGRQRFCSANVDRVRGHGACMPLTPLRLHDLTIGLQNNVVESNDLMGGNGAYGATLVVESSADVCPHASTVTASSMRRSEQRARRGISLRCLTYSSVGARAGLPPEALHCARFRRATSSRAIPHGTSRCATRSPVVVAGGHARLTLSGSPPPAVLWRPAKCHHQQ